MSELPKGWESAAIGEINTYNSGNIDPQSKPKERFELYSVPIFPTRKPENAQGADIGSTKQKVAPGDVLLCKINPRINRVWQVAEKGNLEQIASSEWIVIRQPLIDSNFLRHQLCEHGFRERLCAEVSGVGGSLTRAQPKKVATYKIVLPPPAEQTRIAKKLDELLAQIDTLKVRLDAIPTLLKRFRQSVLADAVSGRLTDEWRVARMKSGENDAPDFIRAEGLHKQIKNAHEAAGGHARGNASNPTEEAHDLSANDLPDCWEIAVLRDICVPGRPITYGILKPGPELEEGVPYIRVADFPGNKLNMTNIKKTSTEIDQQFKRARLIENDLLLSIRGSVGRLIKIPATLEGANITQDTARLSISPLVSTDFVYWVLLAGSTQRRMKNATRGVAVRGINIGDVRALQIPLPAREEQTEIVRRVEQLFAFVDQLEGEIKNAQERINHLTQSILAKAFRGELTADWRVANLELISGENSADALLKKIKAERETHAKQSKARKASTNKKTGQHMSKGIITVTLALEAANKPLTGQQLMTAAGYPRNSTTEQLESFFLDIRDALEQQRIVKLPRDENSQDWFALSNKE